MSCLAELRFKDKIKFKFIPGVILIYSFVETTAYPMNSVRTCVGFPLARRRGDPHPSVKSYLRSQRGFD